jgi:fluoroacetyl-CoA thioesterase
MASDRQPTIDPEGSVPGTARSDYRKGEATLEPGIERSHEFTVNERLLTDVGGTIGVRVLSTPGMIAMMERNAAILSYEHLPEGKATVGFEVCVKHVAGAAEGAVCTAHARLREVVDGRKLRFDVEVREHDRTIGVGTHERRVIAVGELGTPPPTPPTVPH